MTVDDFHVEPDPRMALFIGGFDENGHPRPMNPARLREAADDWTVTESTPEGVAGLLGTSRALFVQSFFVYEFLTVSALLALQAVEASLKVRLDVERLEFARLIERAAMEGLLSEEARGRLDAGRLLRNQLSHPHQ